TPARPGSVAASLAPLLNQPVDQVLAALTDSAKGPIGLVADAVDFETGRDIRGRGLPGIEVVRATRRLYPERDLGPALTGLLGRASRPSFRLSQLPLPPSDTALYRNRAVTDLYEPGSVMKVMTMATGIDSGLVTPGTTYFDSGTVVQGGYKFQNWDFSANGIQTMSDVLQKSLNTGAIWVANVLGADRLYASLKRFGFGESTHSGMGGE